MIWWALTALVVFWLFFVQAGRSAVGGGLTLGLPIGVAIAAFQPTFAWAVVGKTMIVCALIGVVFELLPLIPKLWER